MKSVALGDLMVNRGGSLNPALFADELFELYSIPAHDRGGAELLHGREIGSSKQCVEPGDVMISKIIPHIRRARVVAKLDGSRQIASGEWIVFRGSGYDPNYLRHFLLSDQFHVQYMATVAGVGGSLVRARPEQVKSIRVPLPSLDEQRRIAAILDQADALRAKRRQVLAHLDALAQSIFHDMFAAQGSISSSLAELAEIWDCPHSTPSWTTTGEVCLRTPNLSRGGWNWDDTRYVDVKQFNARSKGGGARAGDIILSREGTVGIAAIVEPGMRVCMGQRLVQVRVDYMQLLPEFALAWLLVELHPERMGQVMVGSTAQHLNVKDLREMRILVPPRSKQRLFADRMQKVHRHRNRATLALGAAEEVFDSLQQRAFQGEL